MTSHHHSRCENAVGLIQMQRHYALGSMYRYLHTDSGEQRKDLLRNLGG